VGVGSCQDSYLHNKFMFINLTNVILMKCKFVVISVKSHVGIQGTKANLMHFRHTWINTLDIFDIHGNTEIVLIAVVWFYK
jgi:hypothetical protein